MKQILNLRVLLVSAALLANSYLPAQSSHTIPFVNSGTENHNMLLAGIKASNEKTFTHFTRTYPNAVLQNVRNEKDGAHISATINGNTLRLRYDKKGKFQSSVLSYPAAELREQIAEQVMVNFPGYSIFGTVLDVKVGSKSALLVMIENKKSWRRIRLTENGMDIYQEYVKSF